MTTEPGSAHTRRALLTAGLAAATASIAAALGRPTAARAANGEPVILGSVNAATATTRIDSTATAAVIGASSNSTGRGLLGYASAAAGATRGVEGRALSTGGTGTMGRAIGNGTGVYGFSGPGEPPAGPARTGVYGRATQDANARGVHGVSVAGRGVYGQASSGQGVRGHATSGTGVYASVADPMVGVAVRAVGRVRFDHCAGVATVPSTAGAVTVVPGIELSATSAIVATLQANAFGQSVEFVDRDLTANTFRIYLTGTVAADTPVAWHVFG